MGNENLKEEIKKLMEKLNPLSMGQINEAQQMETVEKKLNAKVALLISSSLTDIYQRLQGLEEGLSKLIQAIRDGIKSNEEFSEASKKYYKSLKTWSIVLGIATIGLGIIGFWQAYLLSTYTKETQKLSKTAQEQLDLQLQPALVINTDTYSDEHYTSLFIVNIGNGSALNIEVTSDDKEIDFIELPNFIDTTNRIKRLYFVEKRLLNNNTIKRNDIKSIYAFKENKELAVELKYENINRRKYFTKLKVSAKGVKLISRGAITQ